MALAAHQTRRWRPVYFTAQTSWQPAAVAAAGVAGLGVHPSPPPMWRPSSPGEPSATSLPKMPQASTRYFKGSTGSFAPAQATPQATSAPPGGSSPLPPTSATAAAAPLTFRAALAAHLARLRAVAQEEAQDSALSPRARELLDVFATMRPSDSTPEDVFEVLRVQALRYVRDLLQLPPQGP